MEGLARMGYDVAKRVEFAVNVSIHSPNVPRCTIIIRVANKSDRFETYHFRR